MLTKKWKIDGHIMELKMNSVEGGCGSTIENPEDFNKAVDILESKMKIGESPITTVNGWK